MENKKNFYEETYQKIVDLIFENKYEEAIKILDEELSMPYIPSEYESKFVIQRNKIDSILNKDSKKSSDRLSFSYISDFFYDGNLEDIEKLDFCITNLNYLNLRNNIDEVKEFFNLDRLPNWVKADIFLILANQKIEISTTLNNNEISTKDYMKFEEQSFQTNIKDILKNKEDDKIIQETSIKLFDFYVKNIFPEKIEKKEFSIYAGVFSWFANKMILDIDIKDKVLKKYNLLEKEFDAVLSKIG
ncbi:MAG: hypothetical protein HRS57_02395 [Mycoplasmataceae bacterium]|nr:hypothetical protein [Mycoplasmataceae bacterium]